MYTQWVEYISLCRVSYGVSCFENLSDKIACSWSKRLKSGSIFYVLEIHKQCKYD